MKLGFTLPRSPADNHDKKVCRHKNEFLKCWKGHKKVTIRSR